MTTRVLVVDANREFGILIRQSLEEGGQYSVSVANSGMEALTMAAETAFEVAVIDLDLPDIQGQKVVRRLREAQPELKLVVIPESGTQERQGEDEVPVEGVLRKPFYLPDLPKILQETLESPPLRARREDREVSATGVADLEAQFDAEADVIPGQIPSLEQASALLDAGIASSEAKAALLLRDRRPIAQAGDISAGTVREASRTIPESPSRGRAGDLVQYLRLRGRRDELLLYGTEIADRLSLVLLFPAETPIGVARKQTGMLAQKLLEGPHEAPEVTTSEEDDALATISEAHKVQPRPRGEPEEMTPPEAVAKQPRSPDPDAEEIGPPEEEAQEPDSADAKPQALEPEPSETEATELEPSGAQAEGAGRAEAEAAAESPTDEEERPAPEVGTAEPETSGVEADEWALPQAEAEEPKLAEAEAGAEAPAAEEEKAKPSEAEAVEPETSGVEADETELPEAEADERMLPEAEAVPTEAPAADEDETDIPVSLHLEAGETQTGDPQPAEVEVPAAKAAKAEEEKPAPEAQAVEPEPSDIEADEGQVREAAAEQPEVVDIDAEAVAPTELEAETPEPHEFEAAELEPAELDAEEASPPEEAEKVVTPKVEAGASKPPEPEAAAPHVPEVEAQVDEVSEVEIGEPKPAEREADEGEPEPERMPADWVPEAQLSSTQEALFEQWADLEPPEADPEPGQTPEVTGEGRTAGSLKLPTDWIPQDEPPQGRLAFFDDLMGAQESEKNGEAAPSSVRPLVQPTSYHLTFNAVLIPRFPEHELTGSLAEQMSHWTRRLCLAWDWRADWIRVEPQALHLQVSLIPESAPAQAVERLMQGLSERIIDRYPRMRKELPSGRFWARPYLLTAGDPPQAEQVRRFIRRTRRAQGFEA